MKLVILFCDEDANGRIVDKEGVEGFATICLKMNDFLEPEEARIHFELGLQSALQNQERAFQAIIRVYLGRVIARKDPRQIDAAEESIRQVITLLEELGLRAFYPLGYIFWEQSTVSRAGLKKPWNT